MMHRYTSRYGLSSHLTALLLAVLVVFSAAAEAQTTGKIAGRVTDAATGEGLPGANVVVEGVGVGAATDINGNYMILGIRPGSYAVTARYIGYAATRIEEVRVSVDLTTDVNFELVDEVFMGQEIVVTASAEMVRRDLTSSEVRITSEQIRALPVQEIGDLLTAQAGITTSASGIHIRGGRSSEVAYFVDGVRVSDSYTGGVAMQIENRGIEELQIISGTYNAEYGQAMSGIVNVVTRDPERVFTGSFEAYSGSYAVIGDGGADYLRSTNAGAYPTRGRLDFAEVDPYSYLPIRPNHYYSLSGSLSGPIVADRLGFFALGRYFHNDGWLYGARIYDMGGNPVLDSAVARDSLAARGINPADSSLVAMNPFSKFSGQASLRFRMNQRMFFNFLFLGSFENGQGHDFGWRQAPDGRPTFSNEGYNANLQFTHTLSARAFYTANLTNFRRSERSSLFEDPLDPRYNDFLINTPDYIVTRYSETGAPMDSVQVQTGAGRFLRGGTNLGQYWRTTNSWTLKTDLTAQISNIHMVKVGIEGRLDNLSRTAFGLIPDSAATGTGTQFVVPGVANTAFTSFQNIQPVTFSMYAQDKIELESMVMNVGLRFDYFNPRSQMPADPEDPNIFAPIKSMNIYRDLNGNGQIDPEEMVPENRLTLEERAEYWYRDAEAKLQFSPRLGIAYPISEQGVLHFSWGYFFQIPTFEFLFNDPNYRVSYGSSGRYGPYGNPDIMPQRTVMYELGLQQGFGDNMVVDLTGFYRDVRNWVSTSIPIPTFISDVDYITFTNRDFSSVWGITLAVTRRFARGYGFNVDYTFQVADGTNSRPDEQAFSDVPRLTLIPLEWDQRHTLNGSIYTSGRNWGLSFLGRLGSGYPYTPVFTSGTTVGVPPLEPTNSRRRPATFRADASAHYYLPVGPARPKLFLQVYNLLDRRNANVVFGDTGQPDVTRDVLPSYDPGYYVRPEFYDEPRRLHLGVELTF
ncbi:TonB-dependent receptor [soil metagenome]